MGIRIKYILLIIYQSVLIQLGAYSQKDTINNSFVHANFTSIERDKGYAVSAIAGTKDGGFVYLDRFPKCAIDSSFNKFILSKDLYDTCCIEKPNFRINNGRKAPVYLFGRSLLIKTDKKGNIEWAKSIFNEDYPANGGYFSLLKQIRDNGFITSAPGRIVKLDSIGNIKWKLYFNKDSILGIKKSKFLSQAGISDIYECKDSSFIALVSASFSLLKITKDGKPLWLKSTIFDEFSPINYEYFSFQDSEIDKADTIFLNQFVWNQGGGVYVPTYNIYETDDGGYLSIGQNKYRDIKNIVPHKKGDKLMNKIFCVKDDYTKKTNRVFPEKIYTIRHFAWDYPLTNEEKVITGKKYTTVVVKTDKNGKVEWTKQFGEMSYATNPRSTLIKLANGQWMVNIVDCDSIGMEYNGRINFGPPHSEIYIIDNNGKIIKQQKGLSIEPYYGAALAPDSGYYFFNQDEFIKTDKNFLYQCGRVFGGRAKDVGVHAITADGGVLCEEEGRIYKFDKYCHKPSDSVSVEVIVEKIPITLFKEPKTKDYKIENLGDSTYMLPFVHFKINTNSKDAGILRVVPFDFETNDKYKSGIITYSVSIDGTSESINLERKKNELKQSGKRFKDARDYPFYKNTAIFKPGIYNYSINENVIDLSDSRQLNGLFLIPKNYVPIPKAFEFINFYGYRDIYTEFLLDGKYTYHLLDRETGEIRCSGTFEYIRSKVK